MLKFYCFLVFNLYQKRHPSALDMFERIIEASRGKEIVMFLDYDGTLSPIVADPDRAFISSKVLIINPVKFSIFSKLIISSIIKYSILYVSQMRRTVKKLAKCFPTSIVTGRCIDKVHFYKIKKSIIHLLLNKFKFNF